MRESKEKIKSRMIKNASRLWGYHDTESESSFDPLVGLLMGALAFELEKISADIHSSESRVVEKLVQLLTPEPIVGTLPAHGILRAQPHQPSFIIHPRYQFYFNKRIKNPVDPTRVEEKNIFFTPAGSYKLFNGEVKYIAGGGKVFEFQKEGYKEQICEMSGSVVRESREIWIGIEFKGEIDSYDDLLLYFDIRSEFQEDIFYHSLARAKWDINDKQVRFENGFGGNISMAGKTLDAMIKREIYVSGKVADHVNRFYQKRFMILDGAGHRPHNYSIPDNFPRSLQQAFDDPSLKLIKSHCQWIRIEFLQPIPAEVLDNIFCSINSFPVINRQLNDFTYSAGDQINVIPLNTRDSFLDMEQVTNAKGNTYEIKSFSRVNDLGKGNYILRHGGIARFDSRDAMEILNYLMELLHDESAAFSILGAGMITSNLRELNQIIARFEQQMKESNIVKENIHYLILKAMPKNETVFVEFWSTNGALANGIKAGTSLNIFKGSDINQGSASLLTMTEGGREKMDTEDRLNAYRRALLSKDRIVTAEDIKALSYEHFGKAVDSVEVKKGISMGVLANSGFVRTIDVYVHLSKFKNQLSEEEIQFLKEDFKIKLEEKSMNLMPFRVFIQ
ncbi:MAG: hypothetical protein NTX61_15815 [Bacteroidetes bacterium]|nr:hypothetical protein [Bacteroidota bacterium]